jgi:thiol:disulfide interchange protein
VRFNREPFGKLSIAVGSLNVAPRLDLVLVYARPGLRPEKAFLVHAVRYAPEPAGSGGVNWLAIGAIAGALTGGLLLNLMPCVFPILSIKAMALMRAGNSPGEARSEALGYLAGATATMVALGAAVLLLRAGGNAAGWAFQLQDPRLVAVLLVLVTAIAANFAGLFELPSLTNATSSGPGFKGGMAGGALAAFIATPCTGPFMAGALGAALVLPAWIALCVFAALGIGLAAPFVALGFFEPLRAMLPKPGAWMVTLRHILSVPMFATALGLAWLLGKLAGVNGMTTGMAVAVTAGLALWWVGLRQRSGKGSRLAMILAIAPAVALPFLISPAAMGRAEAGMPGNDVVLPFSWERLAKLQQEHRPVLLYATADWCITCKVNEATSLSASSVQSAFRHAGAVMLEADWTRSNPEVTRLLERYGRMGVPMYVWFPANGAPKVLPQVLTPSMVAGLVKS